MTGLVPANAGREALRSAGLYQWDAGTLCLEHYDQDTRTKQCQQRETDQFEFVRYVLHNLSFFINIIKTPEGAAL